MSTLVESLTKMVEKHKKDPWELSKDVPDYTLTVSREGNVSLTVPEHTVDVTNSLMMNIASTNTNNQVTTNNTSSIQLNTSNTTGSISLGNIQVTPNNIMGTSASPYTTSPYSITNMPYNIPSYSIYRAPQSVYADENITKELLDTYENGSFIFDKKSKVMIYKDEEGNYFIQEPYRRIDVDDIEKELLARKDDSILQSTVDEYFGK